MAIKVTSIDELDPELVAQLHAEFSQLVQERHPEIELTSGVFHDLVAYFAGGVAGAWVQTEVDRLVRSGSLLEISTDPALADDELVDRVLSNYRVSRKQGAAARGEISIVVSADTTVVIPSGLTFTASGATFTVDSAFTAKPSATTETLTETERILQPLGNGSYSFSVDATAAAVGAAGNIRRGTQLTPDAPPQNYVTAAAATDFLGGADTELNAALLRRLQEGVAAKVLQGRVNITALLREQVLFEDLHSCSIVGFGNAEMTRDQHSILPISCGGRVDIYARSAALPQTITLTKEATLVDVTAAGGIWQFSMLADDAPGFYEVTQIAKLTDAVDVSGFPVLSDVRGLDLPAGEFAPDLIGVEGVYSKYQTAVIRFVDNETSTADLTVGSSKATYRVAVAAMPLIAELQDFCNNADVRSLSNDIAVKAAVPCFLTLNFDIHTATGATAPDSAAILADLETEINNLGFPGQLHASLVTDIVHRHLRERQAVGRLVMHGRIRQPDGEQKIIRATDVLQIPDTPGALVTGRTTAFLLDKADIGLSIVTQGFTTGI